MADLRAHFLLQMHIQACKIEQIVYDKVVGEMQYSIAEKFENGTFEKPIFKVDEFYKGGFSAMQKRFGAALAPYHGAYKEYAVRTENQPLHIASEIMRDYVQIV